MQGTHFIAQEFVPGQNLGQLLEQQEVVQPVDAVSIMSQVASALQKAAEKGIVHRDIKPENIMLSPSGEVKVADFGVARLLDGDVRLTHAGMTMGTPLYMSPEQIEGTAVDQRSDLYSLGITSYQMLSGQHPFRGETPMSVALQHLQAQPQRLEELGLDLPIGLCCVVHKLMAKEAQDRFAGAGELQRELQALELEGASQLWTGGASQQDSNHLRSTERLAATQQLAAVMAGDASPPARGNSRWPLIGLATLAVVVAILVGSLAALAVEVAAAVGACPATSGHYAAEFCSRPVSICILGPVRGGLEECRGALSCEGRPRAT